MNKENFIAVVAGKSGGHIIPAMTFAQTCMTENAAYKLIFFSGTSKLDTAILGQWRAVHSHVELSADAIPGKKPLQYPRFIAQCIVSFVRSFRVLRSLRPERVISIGGFVSVPVCLAAWCLGIPIELFELNATPGKAVAWLTRLACKTYVCFSEAQHFFPTATTALVPYPLRYTQEDTVDKAKACRELGMSQNDTILLVLGGSQGSQFINRLMTQLASTHDSDIQSLSIIHQTGASDIKEVQATYESLGIKAWVFDYTQDLKFHYVAADIVIARAGAGTLFELAFFKKPSIIIPLETKVNVHQVDNAVAMAKQEPGLFTIIRQKDIENNPEIFFEFVKKQITSEISKYQSKV